MANTTRILDKSKISYKIFSVVDDGNNDGLSVTKKIEKEASSVFKTLVTQSNNLEFYVFVIPVSEELNLKKAAKAAKEKRVEMIPVKNILNATAYLKGGCSPIGMKKSYKTYLDSSVNTLERMIISGGKTGTYIELSVSELLKLLSAETADLIK